MSLLRGPTGVGVRLAVADAAGAVRRVSLERRLLLQPSIKEVLTLPGIMIFATQML